VTVRSDSWSVEAALETGGIAPANHRPADGYYGVTKLSNRHRSCLASEFRNKIVEGRSPRERVPDVTNMHACQTS
jgi:hypothetical protein